MYVMKCPCGKPTIGEIRFFDNGPETDTIVVVNYGHENRTSCLWCLDEDGVWRRQNARV